MRFALTWPRPATAFSILGHAVLLTLLAIEAPRRKVVVQPPAAVEVIIVARPERRPNPTSAARPSPAVTTQSEVSDRPSPPPIPAVRPSPGLRITATEYYSGTVLDDPRNQETKQRLATLSNDERLIQLCNIEAIEQLRRWKAGFVPDHVVAYATADPSLTDTSLIATGAAVYAGGKWYRLAFSCNATSDLGRVATFTFTLGRPIPRQEWERDGLPEQVDGDMTD
ncbi:hypothetical protein CJ014_22315 [Pleomorphomonas carboxyditropha]|uniref:DUF930 domain-containing protein n=1 Tax=Pleomorphomonas carboxyditropha TaxID=2023338 RepID=A0A2G9WQP6_9HYPH|nr:hypothetical protein CJ014_22315 [Pleomorphomonas carboxyditropha]